MSWWGKGLGATVGFALGGPLGALLGGVIGHQVDRKAAEREQVAAQLSDQETSTQAAFFTATFAVMGHLAKVDGKISESEIAMARHVMYNMQLNDAQMRAAIDLFNRGKSEDFNLDAVLDQFHGVVHKRSALLRMFLEIEIGAAFADGVCDPNERELLQYIASRMGYSKLQFQLLFARISAIIELQGLAGSPVGGQSEQGRGNISRLQQAYAILEIDANASDEEVKKSYRRLMSHNHPDKLVSKGLPEEMIRLATEKTRQIKESYDISRKSR